MLPLRNHESFANENHSFLDESRNTDLICWSESGDSFIVLDEDEFAKTLIPELFKHNNYASFVRQLNMYGFHKKVGLSDNSMRASERKNKNPSEYSNPYFKRGRPNLLWLIQKPKTQGAKGGARGAKARQEDYDEEAEETYGRDNGSVSPKLDQIDDGMAYGAGRQNLLTMGNNVTPPPSQEQLSTVQRELAGIRETQFKITQMLQGVRREHAQLYGQAKAFHDLHEKHDTSINAILTFLATVYEKKFHSGQGGMGDMFPNPIPNNEQQHGNVVDMGDVPDDVKASQLSNQVRKLPRLIEAAKSSPVRTLQPPQSQTDKMGHSYDAAKLSPLTKFPYDKNNIDKIKELNSSYNSWNPNSPQYQQPHSPTIQELSDASPSTRSSESPRMQPDTINKDSPQQQQQQQQQQIPQADIMSMLNNANAQNASFSPNAPMDFSEALSHLQNSGGNTPLTPGQRQNMLQLMGDEYPQGPNNANTLAFPSPPAGNQDSISGSLAPLDRTSNNLDQIGHIIREQGANINNLSNTLTPLSPSGSIPGVEPTNANYNPSYDALDIDNIFNSSDYFADAGQPGGDFGGLDFGGTQGDGSGLPDFDFGDAGAGGDIPGFGADGVDDGQDGAGLTPGERVREMDSGEEGTSPANTVNTIE